jgi:hypothetical protein
MTILDISSWWGELTTLESVYWAVAIPASGILVILMILTFFGGEIDADVADADLEVEGDPGIGFQFFSLKNLVGFFTIFGWVGLGMIEVGYSTFATLAVSSFCGLVMMTMMAAVFFLLMRLAENGTLNMKNAIGKHGEIYLIVPAKRGGMGKVQITIQGGLRELSAMTDDENDLPTNSIITVVAIIDEHILLVTKAGR